MLRGREALDRNLGLGFYRRGGMSDAVDRGYVSGFGFLLSLSLSRTSGFPSLFLYSWVSGYAVIMKYFTL